MFFLLIFAFPVDILTQQVGYANKSMILYVEKI